MASEDVSKLPKWAQWRIQRLEKEIADCRKAMDAFAGTTPTNICIDPDAASMRTGAYPRFLPDRAEVEFTLTRGEISVMLRDDALKIMASGYHNNELVIRPHVSNVVECKLVAPDGEAT